MTYIFKAPLFMAAALMATACAEPSKPQITAASVKHADHLHGEGDYIKPGAQVRFSDTYDKASNPGDIENFTVTLTESYESGTLLLRVTGDEGLTQYSPSGDLSFDLGGADSHNFDVQIGTPNAGEYALNLIVRADVEGGQTKTSRHTIRLAVGDAKSIALTTLNTQKANAAKAANAPAHRVLNAQETVRRID